MRCASHPDKDATVQCVVCKKPLCDLCAVPQRDGAFTCDGWAILVKEVISFTLLEGLSCEPEFVYDIFDYEYQL